MFKIINFVEQRRNLCYYRNDIQSIYNGRALLFNQFLWKILELGIKLY